MEGISILDKAFLASVSAALLYLLSEALVFYLAKLRIARGIYPRSITTFPTYECNRQEFDNVKQKIEVFSVHVLAGERVEVTLYSDDLNTLVTKGYPVEKHKPGTYKHYEITDDFVEEKLLRWPFFPSTSGCWTQIYRVRFREDSDGCLSGTRQLIMAAERSKRVTEVYGSLRHSALLRLIFGSTELPAALLKKTASGTAKNNRITAIIDAIETIVVADNKMDILAFALDRS